MSYNAVIYALITAGSQPSQHVSQKFNNIKDQIFEENFVSDLATNESTKYNKIKKRIPITFVMFGNIIQKPTDSTNPNSFLIELDIIPINTLRTRTQ